MAAVSIGHISAGSETISAAQRRYHTNYSIVKCRAATIQISLYYKLFTW